MAKTKISEWSQTASNNTDLNGISCAEGMAPSDVNNWMRELMAQVKDFQVGADGDPLTVAGTFTAQGRADIGGALNVTGATALTGTLTASAGIVANITGNVTGNVTGDITGAGTLTNPTINGFTGNTAVVNIGSGQIYKDTDGNVGVGTSSPASKFHVSKSEGVGVISQFYATANFENTFSGGGNALITLTGSDTAYIAAMTQAQTAVDLVIATGQSERMRITSAGDAIVTGAGGLGYGAGSGGTVTQDTSKATTVAINKTNGQIITHNAQLSAGAEVSFLVNNSTVAATDTVIINLASGGTTNTYVVGIEAVSSGSFRVILANLSGTNRSEALTLNFAVIKAVTS